MDLREIFGKRLKQLRQERNLTQAELAAKAQVSAQMISSYENLQKEPGLTSAVMLARALDVPIEKLISSENSTGTLDTKLNTYGDVFRMISALDDFFISINYHEGEWIEIDDVSHKTEDFVSLNIIDSKVTDFCKKFGKMHGLLADGTISADLFHSWLDGEILKGDSELTYPELPF